MKHSYQTRRLLAMQDLRHDGQNVIAGGEVFATETDANYLIRSGHAREADQPVRKEMKVDAPALPTRRGPGRPPRAEIAARPGPIRAAAPSQTTEAPAAAPAGVMTMADMAGTPTPDGAADEAPAGGQGEAAGDAAG